MKHTGIVTEGNRFPVIIIIIIIVGFSSVS